MQHLLLIRHGQTDANAAGIVQGHMPTELNPLGHRQSSLLAERLKAFTPTITTLLTSPLTRAVQTAAPIAAALSLPAHHAPAWVERHFGSGQGKPANLSRIISHGTLSSTHADPDDAEPRDTFDARVRAALASLPPTGTTAVITHGGVIGSVMRQILAQTIPTTNPPQARPHILNCSIQHLHRPTPTHPWTIETLCDAAHLSGLETAADAG